MANLIFSLPLILSFFLPSLGNSQPLKPEQAFQIQARIAQSDRIEVTVRIAEGYYLYRDKLKFALLPEELSLGPATLPKGRVKKDPYFGSTQIYRDTVSVQLPFKGRPKEGQTPALSIAYQGCSDAGLCYPPKVQKIQLDLSSLPGSPPPRVSPSTAGAPITNIEGEKGIAGLFRNSSTFWVILSFFGFGLLLSLTPCVFPMIPILSGIIVAQGQEATKIRSFLLSLTYVLGMALTYTAAGVAAGLSGRLIAAALQNPWVLGGFALIFVALALSMFGWYDLQLPSAFLGKMTAAGNKQKAGTFLGVFIMGVLSGLIIGPCVTAPLAGALVYISRHQDVWLGGTALFSLSLGMGVPLLILGTSAGFLLPRAGEWMMAVKAFFGWILLGVAVWIVSPVIPGPVALFLWGALLITGSIYLNSLDPLPVPAGGWARYRKGIGVLTLLIGLTQVIGAFTGGTDPFQPLSGIRPGSEPAGPKDISPASNLQPPTSTSAFQTVTGLGELERFLKEAAGWSLMLYVGADWCTACKELERFTFADPKVQQKLQDLKLVKADVTRDTEQTRALLKKFGLFGPPAVLFFDGKGEEIPGTRVIGVQKAGEFMVSLTKIIIPDLSQ